MPTHERQDDQRHTTLQPARVRILRHALLRYDLERTGFVAADEFRRAVQSLALDTDDADALLQLADASFTLNDARAYETPRARFRINYEACLAALAPESLAIDSFTFPHPKPTRHSHSLC